jgi:acyl-CoA synthetase
VTAATSVQLPGEVFSSPVFVDSWVLLGCRDDHLYCLKVADS